MKVAITGTTSGIGKCLAEKFSHCDVVPYNRPLHDLLQDECLDAIDLSGFDLLINNAGADYNRKNFNTHYVDWKATIKINLIVPMYLTQKFIQQNTTGIVVNITSTGSVLTPTTNSTIYYRTSKVALKHYTNEVNQTHSNFRIIDIEPGKTQTNFTQNAGSGVDYSDTSMAPECVADAVWYAFNTPHITHMRIKK